MRFSIVNLGCKVNRVESDDVAAALISAGGSLARTSEADLVVVNTCTVTGEADKKARKAVRQALRANPSSTVVVTGCAAAIDAAAFTALDPRVRVVPKGALQQTLAPHAAPVALRVGEGFRTRVNVKIQDGCDHACTFCIVHVARGKATSRPFSEVRDEVAAYARAGAREVVLTGINLGSYRSEGRHLPDLLEALLADGEALPGGGPRLRVSSIEPQQVDWRLIELLARAEGRVCRHLHVSLQSGSTRVLGEMERTYTAPWFEHLIGRLRAEVPGIALSTDVIAGFPGETDDDFRETCRVVERLGFGRLHVFPYSKRAGTPAAMRVDQVPDEVKRSRAAELRLLSDELTQRDYDRRVGTRELALVEDGVAVTESYHEIPVPGGARRGDLVEVVMPPRGDARARMQA
ncbi:MiaB/RimO family radical SAM methylthiotransferase [Eggerthellaceae bacterium zg-997]|nr:MiaB/RimO family radical SAM methylthiotransferase [Eggerthellaceae bacterium zg-997]